MPSVSRELTQLLTSNMLKGQSSPSVSTTHDQFINSDVSNYTVPVENCVNNAENRIVCHSKSSILNFDSSAHSHSNSRTEIHCNSLTNDKTNDISCISGNFSGVSGQHISNSSSTKLSSNSEANEIDNLIGVIPSIKDKCFSQKSDFDKFERKMVSQLDALDQLYGQYADMCNTFEKYCASFLILATQLETHKSNNKFQTPVSPVGGKNPSEKRDHYRKSGESA